MYLLVMLFSFLSTLPTYLTIFQIIASPPCPPSDIPYPYTCKPTDDSYTTAYKFLHENLPSWDLTNAESLGFHNKTGVEVDGLEDGIATLGINISLATKQNKPWAHNVPEDIYNEYVVPYAHVNEARNNWRPLLTRAVDKIFETNPQASFSSIPDIVKLINSNLWETGVLGNNVTFKSSQTPLIYDPMSAIVFGYASCTGVSILFADALRAAGIPARIAGTPAWNGDPANGNHNWVEVYNYETEAWHFIEAAPAGGGETLENPCDKWFCTKERMDNGTQMFSSRWQFDSSNTVYPMAWDMGNREVPGVNRTDYYYSVCNNC